MKIALAQINTTINAFEQNAQKILDYYKRATGLGADIVVYPELAVTGYPPHDWLNRSGYVEKSEATLKDIAKKMSGPAAIIGYAAINRQDKGKPVHNSAAVIYGGRVDSTHHKILLPTYDVFDEARYFEPAGQVLPATINDTEVGITICEDIWNDADFWKHRLYHTDPVRILKDRGAAMIITISASPFDMDMYQRRLEIATNAAKKYSVPFVYLNLVGGNDSLVFDGTSFAVDKTGKLIARAKAFQEDLIIVDLDSGEGEIREIYDLPEQSALMALELGTRDYLAKTGFSKAVIGLSGGIDSALTAVVAARALGPENVLGVSMPSRYSSEGSTKDSEALAKNLGIEYREIPIENVFTGFLDSLAESFEGTEQDITEENLQARIRGTILMALSNKFDMLVLNTGNKSESATGYCTLYGDMCGGLAVLSDVPKTLVYDISRFINADREMIPENIITKAPSAELRPDQKDQDWLPPYEVLDKILHEYIEGGKDRDALVHMGFDENVVDDVLWLVLNSEYKRGQAPPGIRITSKAFGWGRRFPIAQGKSYK